jgi:hypothetical protein
MVALLMAITINSLSISQAILMYRNFCQGEIFTHSPYSSGLAHRQRLHEFPNYILVSQLE